MSVNYDGVILAAGRNTRLAGIVPSYYKPLLIVQGRPLVVRLLMDLKAHTVRQTVVVSPDNARPICDVLAANGLLDLFVNVVVQPEAHGPGEGLYRALRCCNASRIVLACGDNAIPVEDFENAISEDHGAPASDVTACTTTTNDEGEAARFTRVQPGLKEFIEGKPGGRWEDGDYRYWVGPLLFDRDVAEVLFQGASIDARATGNEAKISGVLNKVPGLRIRTSPGHSFDIGTADALLEKVNG